MREKAYGGVMTGEELFCRLSSDDVYRSQASMYLLRTDYQQEHNITFYEGITHEDHLFTFLCILKAKRAAHINEALFTRRFRVNSIMTGATTFKNVEGLLTCFIEMYLYTANYIVNEKTKTRAYVELLSASASATEKYSTLAHEEQANLNKCPHSMQVLMRILADWNGLINWLKELQREHEALLRSPSFRMGRALTWFPRKIRGLFRCLRDNGLQYTLKHLIRKLYAVHE